MPLTTGLTSRTAAKGEGHIHSDKWHRCVEQVKAKGGDVDPYAVCTFSIGYNKSVNPEHQTPGPHSSRDTRRFKRRKERAEKMAFVDVLKWSESEHPRKPAGNAHGGEFTSDGEGSAGTASEGTKPRGSSLTPSQKAMQETLRVQSQKPVHKVKTAEEAVPLVLKGENVEIQDTKEVHTLLKKLGEMAIEAKRLQAKAPSFDPCTITVKGVSLFCTEKLRTEDFPEGIPRIEMPQFKSKNPIPGSEADKLPRDQWGEVDGSAAFLDHLTGMGVTTNPDAMILARKLKASQAEMEGQKVAALMVHPERDPKKAKIWVSNDGYVIDGHHTWAAAIGRDAEDGDLDNDTAMEVVEVDMNMSQIYHVAKVWTEKFGLPAAGVKKRDRTLTLHV